MLSEVTCSLQGPQGQVENILETFVDSFKLGVTNTAGLIVAFWVFVFWGGWFTVAFCKSLHGGQTLFDDSGVSTSAFDSLRVKGLE